MAKMTREQINNTGIMAGMTVHEINDFMDNEIKEFMQWLSESGYHDAFDKMFHLRWLSYHAIMYAHSDGLFDKAMGKAEVEVRSDPHTTPTTQKSVI